MPTEIGDTLRRARLERGMELADAEAATKIRSRHLLALEEGRLDDLPGEAYARGFLRTYAQYLGLDPGPLLEARRREHPSEFEAGTGLAESPIERPPPGPRRSGGGRRTAIALVAVLAALAALLAILGAFGGGGGGSTQPVTSKAGHGHSGGQAAPKGHEKPAQPAGEVSLALRATGTVWVCLTDDQGKALVDGVTMSPGERQGPFRGPAFDLNLGNGAMSLVVDGKAVTEPPSSDPVGYRIGPAGVRDLPAGARPTCS